MSSAYYRHSHTRRRRFSRTRPRHDSPWTCIGSGGNLATAAAELAVFCAFATGVIAVQLVARAIWLFRRRHMNRKMSALGLPTATKLSRLWARHKRKSLFEALEIGAMLLDITQMLDNQRLHDKKGRISGRKGGLKAWLATYCPEINYATATRHRKLAERLLQLLRLPSAQATCSMCWILPTHPMPASVHGRTAASLRQLRTLVRSMLRTYHSQRRLHRMLVLALAPTEKSA